MESEYEISLIYEDVISYSSMGGKGEAVVGMECFYLWV